MTAVGDEKDLVSGEEKRKTAGARTLEDAHVEGCVTQEKYVLA